MWNEMKSVSSKICTRVAVFISYDDNHNTTFTSILLACTYISFKWSIAGLNSEFYFSSTGCLTKAKEPKLLFTHNWKETNTMQLNRVWDKVRNNIGRFNKNQIQYD